MITCASCRYCDHGVNSTPPPGFPETAPALHWMCLHRGHGTYDHISGNVYYSRGKRPCSEMRRLNGECGLEAARLWEEAKAAPSVNAP